MRAASFLWLILAFLLGVFGLKGPYSPDVVVLVVVVCAGMSTLTLGFAVVVDAIERLGGLNRR